MGFMRDLDYYFQKTLIYNAIPSVAAATGIDTQAYAEDFRCSLFFVAPAVASGDTITFKVQESTDNSTWTDVAKYEANGSSTTAYSTASVTLTYANNPAALPLILAFDRTKRYLRINVTALTNSGSSFDEKLPITLFEPIRFHST